VTTARHLEGLPDTARALRDGEIGYQHASVIADAPRDLGDERVREAEHILVEAARSLDVRRLHEVTLRLRECLDPDGALGEANRLHEQRRLYVSHVGRGWEAAGSRAPTAGPRPRRSPSLLGRSYGREGASPTAGAKTAELVSLSPKRALRLAPPSPHGTPPHGTAPTCDVVTSARTAARVPDHAPAEPGPRGSQRPSSKQQ
jgi:hypothetical protein